jgi:hypothetical protein|tara:strand:- start:4538 stop:4999 length:462 start_codon:yes stop_codon:yes gene_type:complete
MTTEPRKRAALSVDDDLANFTPTPAPVAPSAAAIEQSTTAAGFGTTPQTPTKPQDHGREAADDFQPAAEPTPEFPWQAADVRPGRKEGFPLRFDEQLKAMLKWLDDQGEVRSMNRFIEDALAQAIPAKVAAVLEQNHGHTAKAARKAAELRKK